MEELSQLVIAELRGSKLPPNLLTHCFQRWQTSGLVNLILTLENVGNTPPPPTRGLLVVIKVDIYHPLVDKSEKDTQRS